MKTYYALSVIDVMLRNILKFIAIKHLLPIEGGFTGRMLLWKRISIMHPVAMHLEIICRFIDRPCSYDISIAEDCPSIDSTVTEDNEHKKFLTRQKPKD